MNNAAEATTAPVGGIKTTTGTTPEQDIRNRTSSKQNLVPPLRLDRVSSPEKEPILNQAELIASHDGEDHEVVSSSVEPPTSASSSRAGDQELGVSRTTPKVVDSALQDTASASVLKKDPPSTGTNDVEEKTPARSTAASTSPGKQNRGKRNKRKNK
ncbi:unnamed protein product [Amoebophrya sp. A120]|nr:unnamed protein product [Amoebophrya sp. A120]|eukprot:GSA120T00014587001.1